MRTGIARREKSEGRQTNGPRANGKEEGVPGTRAVYFSGKSKKSPPSQRGGTIYRSYRSGRAYKTNSKRGVTFRGSTRGTMIGEPKKWRTQSCSKTENHVPNSPRRVPVKKEREPSGMNIPIFVTSYRRENGKGREKRLKEKIKTRVGQKTANLSTKKKKKYRGKKKMKGFSPPGRYTQTQELPDDGTKELGGDILKPKKGKHFSFKP